jgi:hypothetical protein
MKEEDDYSDIINLPHHVSTRHPRMSMMMRAAQFSAFEALSGHSERIHEAEANDDELSTLNDESYASMSGDR